MPDPSPPADPFGTAALFTLAVSAAGYVGKSIWEYVAERRKGAEQSRREYEFHARAKLYEQVDPLLFSLRPVLNDVIGHVIGVAREARAGRLLGGDAPWHARADDYHVRAFVYRLCGPAVRYRLIEQGITSYDLGLDPRISRIWRILGAYTRMFRWDFAFGDDVYGLDRYHPAKGPNGSMLPVPDAVGPAFRQGIVAGLRDPMLDRLIVGRGKDARPLTLSEFERHYATDRVFQDALAPLAAIVTGFTPQSRPVFWAIALSHLVLALMAHETLDRAPADLARPWTPAADAERLLAGADFNLVFRLGGDFAATEAAILAAIPRQIASAGRDTSIADAAGKMRAEAARPA